jgi:hypothetical protein
MAFGDPQTITIAGTATDFNNISRGINTSSYATADGLDQLIISHQYGKRTRRTARLQDTKIASDPFTAGLNNQYSLSTYLVVDHPVIGYTPADMVPYVHALCSWLTATSDNVIKALFTGQS